MILGTKAGGKFTIETTIRDKDGNIKEHTIEEGETLSFCRHQQNDKHAEEAEEKTPTAIAEFSIKKGAVITQRILSEEKRQKKIK